MDTAPRVNVHFGRPRAGHFGLVALAIVTAIAAAACGGSSKKNNAATTPGSGSVVATGTVRASSSATPGKTAAGAPTGSAVANNTATAGGNATVLANGTSVNAAGTVVPGGGTVPPATVVGAATPIPTEQATGDAARRNAQETAVVAQETEIVVAATAVAAAPPPDPGVALTAIAEATERAQTGGGRDVHFASTAAIHASTGASFDVVIAVSAGTYQGYEWNIHAGSKVSFITSKAIAASPFKTCATASSVGQGLTYGGCITVGSELPYEGNVETATYHCDSAGKATLQFANSIVGDGFNTSLLIADGVVVGGGSSATLEVDCG